MNIERITDFNNKIMASKFFKEAIFFPFSDGSYIGEVDPQHWSVNPRATKNFEKYNKYKDVWYCVISCPDCGKSQSIFTPYLSDQKVIDAFLNRLNFQYTIFIRDYCKCPKESPESKTQG